MGNRIGVAGCGAMGLPMARRLRAARFDVLGFDIRPLAEFGDFAVHMEADPAAFAAAVDTVVSVVRDARQTFDLCFDAQGIFTGPRPPSRLIISSTLSPRTVAEVGRRLPAGTALIDAPMSGAPYRAAAGTLTFMVGGAAPEVAAVREMLAAMGREIHHLGPTGTGMTCKVLNNLVAATSVAAVRKALKAADALGLERRALLDVMRTSSGGTWYGNHLDDIAWARQGYDSANTIGILEKDVRSYMDAAQDLPGLEPGPFEDSVLAQLRRLEPLD